jgi:hypothetical protein
VATAETTIVEVAPTGKVIEPDTRLPTTPALTVPEVTALETIATEVNLLGTLSE